MVQIFQAEDAEIAGRAGYEARYVADIVFRKPLDSCGVILVDIHESGRSTPHAHEHLEEAFIALREFMEDKRKDFPREVFTEFKKTSSCCYGCMEYNNG